VSGGQQAVFAAAARGSRFAAVMDHDLESERRRRLRAARRVVVKLGTGVVTGGGDQVCAERVAPVARSIAGLVRAGRQVVLVSSGAVGLGAGRLGLTRERLRDLVTRQACAAVGQSLLMHAYEQLFGAHDVKIAQVLLTESDFTDWGRYLNLRRTMEKLLKMGVLPIVNENDTVSTAELEYKTAGQSRVFSDNDRLAALVMSKLEAEALILLTNVDGLLAPQEPARAGKGGPASAGAALIPLVSEITPEVKALATGPSSGGRGGMVTKLEAAEIAMRAGGVAVIANGSGPGTLDRIFNGDQVGTAFVSTLRMPGKRRWIAYAAGVRGRLIVNDGAREAILRGKASLLASGVVRVEGPFAPLDVISIADGEGREFARGVANCASRDAEQMLGQTSSSAARTKAHVLVTRDNIVLTESPKIQVQGSKPLDFEP
jgi:glutamate 5-kinase